MKARRTLSAVGLTGTAALLAAAGGASWYYASRITEPPGARPPVPLARDRVTLRAGDHRELTLEGDDADRPGWWGLVWDGGYARVGPGVTDPAGTRRPVEVLVGEPSPGTTAVFDAYAAPEDPRLLGLRVLDVVVDGPLGPLPAWSFPADGATWAIFVHGRSGTRREALRSLPVAIAAGLPSLAISYRNDPEGPPSPDGRSHLGTTEWEDVAAAVRYALERGARDVVLVGFSMGGACVAELVLRCPELAPAVRAVVLEAPVLDWGPVLRRAAVERGLPPAVLPLLLPPTMALAGARTRIDWRGIRQLGDPDAYAIPTLLIHGEADPTVPVALADAFAETRADVVSYLRIPDAGHVEAWNTDREGYESALRDFFYTVGAA